MRDAIPTSSTRRAGASSGTTRSLDSVTLALDPLDDAIERGRNMVLERQRSDGSWNERGDMGPYTTALTLVSLSHADQLPADQLLEGTRWLRSRQLADGSFRGRPFAEQGDLGATGAAWAALSLSNDAADRAAAERARSFVEQNGGCLLYTSPSPRDS